RAPRDGNWIKPSPLRPPCAAADRIFQWRSLASLDLDDSLRSESDAINIGYWLNLASAFSETTRSSYGAGLLRFHQFCDLHNIPESRRMPADVTLISAFLGCWSSHVSGSAINNWLSGLKAWHDINQQPWLGNDVLIHLGRRSAAREGLHHSRPVRQPVSCEHMRALRRALNLSLPKDAAIWACASTLFWSCRRAGELTVPSLTTFNSSHHVTRTFALVLFTSTETNIPVALFNIPWTKTTKERGARIRLVGRDDDLCPRSALWNHLHRVNVHLPAHAPLFSFSSMHTAFAPLTKSELLNCCNSIWHAAGYSALHGHSFRIGGAVELLLAGLDPQSVAMTGGWTSSSFLLYWRHLDELIPFQTLSAY
ncbi:DNA breaking-rejoining enzyme, partial [Fistulina hepatica ATCC 64428]